MSSAIEQKILEMRFDNKQFESNVSESISTLDKLKGALNFDKLGSNFNAITQAAGKVDLSPISSGVESVIVKFNAMEMAVVQVFANIITNGVNKLQSAVNSLTLDQVTAGWNKYEEKTESVQTIMAATGKSIDEVSEQLARLNWFSDETSYSFTDMTSNVGKFTSVGVDLEDAVSAMEGISTWAALSGANSQTAARAMYNLSQAMGVGAVKLMDWRSIENAGMATTEFKDVVLETAAAMGTLNKFADGTYQTLKGTDVAVTNFSSTLSEGWFSSEVLMESLAVYGNFANELSIACEKLDVETFKLLDAIEAYDGTEESLKDIMEETGLSAKELMPIIENLGSAENELGRKAFIAAQAAKTFKDAIDATKDAVSTQWMNTFEYLFGNFEEAREFFSEVTEYFYNIFATSGNVRNEILEQWSKLGADSVFRDSLLNILESVQNVVDYIRGVIFQVLGIWDKNGDLQQRFILKLVSFTEKFAGWTDKLVDFTSQVEISNKSITGLRNLFNGLGDGLGIIFDAMKVLQPVFGWLVNSLKTVATYLMENVFNNIGRGLIQLRKYIDHYDLFEKAAERVGKAGKKAWVMITTALRPVIDLLTPVAEKIQSIFSVHSRGDYWKLFDTIREKLASIFSIDIDDKKIWAIVLNVRNGLSEIINFLTTIFGQVKDFATQSHLEEFVSKIWETIKKIGSSLLDFLGNFRLSKLFKDILNGISSVSESIFSLLGKINLSAIFSEIKEFGGKVKNVFSNMFSGIKESFSKFNIQDIFSNIANKLGGIFNSFGQIDTSKIFQNLTKGLMVFGGFNLGKLFGSASKGIDSLTGNITKGGIGDHLKSLISPVTDVFDQLKETIGSFTKDTDSSKLTSIAVAVGVLTLSLIALSSIDNEKMTTALKGLAGVLVGLFAEMKGLSKIDFSNGKQFKNIGISIVEIAAAAWIMVQAIKPFAEMETEQIIKAIGAMTIILGEFALFTLAFSKIAQMNQIGNTEGKGIFGLFQKSNGWDKQMKNVAFAMIELGAAMKLFASSAKDFGDVGNLKDAILAMTAVMLEMVGFIAAVSLAGKYGDLKSITKVTFGMIELGVAMKIFASSLSDLGSLQNESLIKGIVGMVAIMLEMVGFIAVASLAGKYGDLKSITKVTFGMIELGVAMKLFASSLSGLGSLESLDLKEGIVGMTAIMLAMVGFIAVASLVGKHSGQILVIAGSMIVLGEAVKIFASVLSQFALYNPTEWTNAIVQLTIVFVELLAFIAVASAASANAGPILIIAASMIVLGLAMKTFAGAIKDFIDIEWPEIKELKNIITTLGALAAIGTIAAPGLLALGIALMTIGNAIALIGIGFAAFETGLLIGKLNDIGMRLVWISDNLLGLISNLNTKLSLDAFFRVLEVIPRLIGDIISGFVAGIISGVGTIIASLGDLFDGAKEAILAFLDFVKDILPAAVSTILTIVLEVMIQLTEKAPEIVSQLFELILKLFDGLIEYLPEIVTKVAELFVKLFDNLTTHIPEMLTSFMNFVGVLFGEIMKVIEGTDQNTLLKLAEMFLGLVAVITVLNLIKSMIPGAMVAVAEVAVLIAEIGGIVALFGMINSIPGVQGLVEKGGDLLEAIGTAVGKFVGGFISGGLESATSSLPKVGENIAKFWENIKPFIDGVSAMSAEAAVKVAVLTGCITALTASDLLGGVADFMRDKLALPEFGASISKLWTNIQPFIEGVSTLKKSTVESASLLSDTILKLTAGELLSGITSFIFGKEDINKFGESIGALGPHIATFSDSVKNISIDAVKTASEALGILAEAFSDNTFKTGGLVQWFTGETTDLKKFGEGIAALGPYMVDYSNSVKDLTIANVVPATKAITEIVSAFDNDVFRTGGVMQWFKGENGIEDFGKALKSLGPNLRDYSIAVAGINVERFRISALAIDEIMKIAENFTGSSWSDRLFGIDKVAEFTGSISQIGIALKGYYENIAAINVSQMTAMTAATQEVFRLFSGETGVTFKIDKDFKQAMRDIASSGISEFLASFSESVTKVRNAGEEFIETFTSGISTSTETIKISFDEFFVYCTDKFNTAYGEFKDAGIKLMTNLSDGIKSVLTTARQSANLIISVILTQFTSYSLRTSFKVAGENLMTNVSNGIKALSATVASAAESVAQKAYEKMIDEKLLSSFIEAGKMLVDKYAEGIEDQTEVVETVVQAMVDKANKKMNDGMEEILKDIHSYMNENFDFKPVITPTFDTSELNAILSEYQNRFDTLIASATSRLAEGLNTHDTSTAYSRMASDSHNDPYGEMANSYTYNFYGDNIGSTSDDIAKSLRSQIDKKMRSSGIYLY